MKHLKRFNESTTENVSDMIKKYFQEKDIDVKIYKKKNDDVDFSFELDYCPIEPEVGSYVERTCVDGTVGVSDNGLELKASVISGGYGCDEEDEDSGIESEYDWEVSSSHDKIKASGLTPDQLIDQLDEFISSYIK